ncbi:hypothetical protein PGT21_026482 [Puccinia graminis f. sp. tritici]|uniref:Uncharacterized protein n=1 Tax=Puccinia graminis f. sp. tritici TaxID=56615 RepID=A0A5B0PV05_PUCGR|nr:hypothetical protein PGTUg99_014142 [Puccinia graminis f. sp. tritici]KAA1104544.1 hypothetical protein PGT21_026482 [Puccinia graminis f. sp. tritici]
MSLRPIYAREPFNGRPAKSVRPPTCLGRHLSARLPRFWANRRIGGSTSPVQSPAGPTLTKRNRLRGRRQGALGATSDCPTFHNATQKAALGPIGGAPVSRAARCRSAGASPCRG